MAGRRELLLEDAAPVRSPDRTGVVERGGVRIAYSVYGAAGPTLLLMPTWTIIHSRFWKGQLGYLARHFRVVTFDGRGNGASDRPVGAGAYRDEEYAADALAVLDATETDQAVAVGVSAGVMWSLHLAADHPERVAGLVAIGAACSFPVGRQTWKPAWGSRLDTTEGWAKFNRHYWLEGGYDDFLQFFFRQVFPEPHSTKQVEDCIRWAHQTTPQVAVDSIAGRMGVKDTRSTPAEDVARRVQCPVLAIHGAEDRICPPVISERLVELTGGELVLLDGCGHSPVGRHPVKVNHLIREFADTIYPRRAPRPRPTWVGARSRPKKALYLSSPIGLGHARRDLAIAAELRKHHPDLQIDWLAQHPVTRVLDDAGETVHPASTWLANESRHFEDESDEHDLHAFQSFRRMDQILVNNFHVFDDVVDRDQYDLVIGDEAWDVDYFLHENPELKHFQFAWMTDFVGWLPMPDGGATEAALAADYNAEMIEQRARYRRLRDRSIFIGDPDDIVDDAFGPGMPGIREWTEENFDFAGYVTGFDPPGEEERARLRARLGYREDDLVCLVTVGGTGVGAPLLRRVLDAVPLARRMVPELCFLLVCGPRIDPATLPRRRGVKVRGYLSDLCRHLAACDLAVVQGGLTTCMELTASRRPFLYVPLQHHFEQNFHVRHRLEQYEAGRCLTYDEAQDADFLAEAIANEVRREVTSREVETGGAARAAAMLAEML